MRRASVALPTPSGPEKSSVWGMRCWAIICPMARVTCSLPQKSSNIRRHDLPDALLDRVPVDAPVDHPDALRLGRRQVMIGPIDLAVKLERLVVHARFARRVRAIARQCAPQTGLDVDVHQDRQIGFESAARD